MVKVEASWADALSVEFASVWFAELAKFVKDEYKAGKHVYHKPKNIFKAFNTTPFEDVKVVILGQDPYHGHGQAQGLSFSVPAEVRNPPSLQNIFKEIESDTGAKAKAETDFGGDLTCWAEQGVLMLNAVLTVERSKPGSHANHGWEKLTDAAIQKLSQNREGIVFMLWGAYARKKNVLIDGSKHLILESPHPSPFSAHTGFLGNKHFSTCNDYLGAPIHW